MSAGRYEEEVCERCCIIASDIPAVALQTSSAKTAPHSCQHCELLRVALVLLLFMESGISVLIREMYVIKNDIFIGKNQFLHMII